MTSIWKLARKSFLSICFIAMLAVTSLVPGTSAYAGTVDLLPGRWTGYGKIKMLNGASERVKCVATYFLKNKGRAINHNLRCASASYRIDATADLDVHKGRVSGQWQERTYVKSGAVAGRVTSSGFNVTIESAGFAAAMLVRTPSACRQSIDIQPKRGLEIKGLTIGLARGC